MRFYHTKTIQRAEHTEIFPNLKDEEAIQNMYDLGYVPSVTNILNIIHNDFLEKWKKKQAIEQFKIHGNLQSALEYEDTSFSDFGTLGHAVVEHFLQERLSGIESPLDKKLPLPAIAAAQPAIQVLNEDMLAPLASEETFASAELGYGGTIDIVYLDKQGNLVVADLKFKKNSFKFPMKVSAGYAYQLAAYAKHLEKKYNVTKSRRVSILCASPFGQKPQPAIHIREWRTDHFEGFSAAYCLWKENHLPNLLG